MVERVGGTGHRRKRTTHVSEATWQKFAQFKAYLIGRKGENAVTRVFQDLGVTALHDVLLQDAQGLTQIDHLVRLPGAIVVIETKTYRGHITGSVGGDEWVQHLDAGEIQHVFWNPLRQNRRHCCAVRAVLIDLDVAIVGIVVSAGSATFSDDIKESVIPLSQLAALLSSMSGGVLEPREMNQAWQQLGLAAAVTEPRRDEHNEKMRRRSSPNAKDDTEARVRGHDC